MVGYQGRGLSPGQRALLWQEAHTLHPVVPPTETGRESAVTKLQQEQCNKSRAETQAKTQFAGRPLCELHIATVAKEVKKIQVRNAKSPKLHATLLALGRQNVKYSSGLLGWAQMRGDLCPCPVCVGGRGKVEIGRREGECKHGKH